MQQTKRRGKKGVILLALALALFILAILPASALAAGSITINGVAGDTTVGSNLVNVGYMSTNLTAAYVTFQVAGPGGPPWVYGAESTPRRRTGLRAPGTSRPSRSLCCHRCRLRRCSR